MQKAEEKTILVVEDEPDVRIVLVTALKDAGFNVMEAGNGHEAYKCVKERMPDFITLDLVMPRQSGALFYHKLRKNSRWGAIPVFIVSAHAHDEMGESDFKDLMRGVDAPPPDGFLEKPVDTTELVRRVGEILDVDVSEAIGDSTDDERSAIMAKLESVDSSVLDKVRKVLGD